MNYKKDALLNTIGNFSYLGALWFISILVVRIGDFEKAGYFSTALTNANIYISLASYTVRLYYAADIKEKFTDSQYFIMRLLTSGVSMILCFLCSSIVGYSHFQIIIIVLFYVYKMAEMVSDILFGALQRHKKLYLSGYSLVLKSIASVVVFAFTLYITQNLIYAIAFMDVVAILILFFIDFPMVKREGISIKIFETGVFSTAVKIIKICFPLFLVGLCYNIIPSIPRLAFERMYTPEQFGIYSSMSTITVLISTAVNCIAVPFVPKFATYYQNREKKKLKRLTIISIVGVWIIGLVALLFASIWGEWVLILIFGNEMSGYGKIFLWVIVAVIFTSIIICLNDFFVAVEQQKYLLSGCITGAILCVVLAIPLCKSFYMNGVAFDLIISQGIEIIILLFGINKILKKIR